MDDDLSDGTAAPGPDGDSWADLRFATGEDEPDRWAWLTEQPDEPAPPDLAHCDVTAVLVTLDAEAWLPETLSALSRLSHKPTRLIAVDNGSTDSTVELLERAHRHGLLDTVVTGPTQGGFGAGVAAALETSELSDVRVAGATQRSDNSDDHWLWLLHDDAVPAPDALQRLLAHVVTDSTVDITGPKLVFPRRRHGEGHQLSEVGVSISGTGRRELGLDLGEIDQGQRDQPRQRLAVSTCGMLLRLRDWQALGGIDADVPCFRDGVELGWRATARGLRVVTTPQAQVVHRQVGRAGLRRRGAGGRHPDRVDQQLGLLLVAGHAPAWRLPFTWLRLLLDCLLRALGYLLGKAPARSRDELASAGWLLTHPRRIRAYRHRLKTNPVEPDGKALVRSLRPPWWSGLRVFVEAVSGTVSDRYREVAGDSEAATLDELTGDEFAGRGERVKRPWLTPAVVVGAVLVVASVVAARTLLGLGHLSAAALLPAPDGLAALWRSAATPIPGAPGEMAPPWLAVMALGSTVLAGQPEWLVSALLLGVVPLAYLAVYPLLRALVADRRVRVVAAVAYALLPTLLGGSNQGRLTLSVVAILLPMLVLALRGLVQRRPRAPEAWRGGWGAGMVLVGLTAFEPSLIFVAVVLGVVGAIWLRRTPRKVGRIGIAVGLPLLVWAPWWPTLIAYPGRLFAGPDSGLVPAGAAPTPWELLIGRETGPGLPPLWLGAAVFAAIWLAAVIGLARRPRRGVVVGAWAAALTALAGAVLLSRLVVTVPPTGTAIRPWTGAYLLIAFAALLLAAAAGVDGLAGELRVRSFGWQQPTSVVAGVLAVLTVLAGAGWWVWAGAAGPVQRQPLDTLPPYLQNAMLSDAGVRVLAIDLQQAGREAHYSVIFDDQLRLGDADRGFAFGGSTTAPDQVADLVQRLVAGTADSDLTPQLRDLGIGYVWVTGASTEEIARIDNTPELGTASGSRNATVWQLEPAVTRVTVHSGDQTTGVDTLPPVVDAGAADRQLRLGEAADPRWRASVDGVPLTGSAAGWQQAFQLPAGGGTVTVGLASPVLWLLIGQGVVVAVGLVLAAPGIRRPEVRDPVRTARRAACVGGRAL